MGSMPCPNPECRHEIPAEMWSDAPVIICPQCNGVFQKQPDAGLPLQPLVVGPMPQPSSRWLTLTMAGLLGAGAAVVSAAALTLYWNRFGTANSQEPHRSLEHNFSFAVPGPPWQPMRDYRGREFIVAINLRRGDPLARFVLAVRLTPAGYPIGQALRSDALHFLRQIAGLEQIETEARPNTELAGASARRFVFQAVDGNEPVSGDVYMVEYQGALYWLLRWCLASRLAEAQPGLDDLRNRFRFLNERPDWKAKQQEFSNAKAGYTIAGDAAIWQRSTFAPERYDPRADLVLESKPAGAAQIVVLVLPLEGASAIERARAYFLARQNEESPGAAVTELNGEAPALAFQVERQPGDGRWFGLYVVERTGSAIVGQCECAWDRRDTWRPEFARLMETMKPTQ